MTQTPTPKGDEEQEMTVEMKACPRCGNGAFVTLDNQVWCRTDRCLRLPPRETEAETIAAWNERAAPAVPQDMAGMVEKLRDGADAVEPNAEHASEPLSADALSLVDAARRAADMLAALSHQPSPVAVGVVSTDRFGNPLNDLGLTPAAQQNMDAIAAAHDATLPPEGADDVARSLLATPHRPDCLSHKCEIDGACDCGWVERTIRAALARAGQGYDRNTLRTSFEKILGADPVCGGRVSSSAVERLVDAAREAAARIEAMAGEIEGLQIHVGRLVSLYDASDLTWDGKPGFADSRDNDGCVYQSSALATAIEHARTALTAPSMKENEDETRG